jgi:hypothetical protein
VFELDLDDAANWLIAIVVAMMFFGVVIAAAAWLLARGYGLK